MRANLARFVLASWVIAAFFHISLIVANAASPAVGDMQNFILHDAPREVPDIEFKDAGGAKIKLSDFRGRMVLLNLWATWCTPCRREMPALDALQRKFGSPDFALVALSLDRKGKDAVEKFYAEIGVRDLVIYVDQTAKIARKLGAPGLPTTLLINREGKEIGRLIGPAEWASKDAENLLAYFLKKP